MNKILIILLLLFTSCNQKSGNFSIDKLIKSDQMPEKKVETTVKELRVEKLSHGLGEGLYRLTIDDSTQVLLYRGVESSAMIKLK